MSLIDEIRTAQRDAAEAAVIRNLERQGLGAIGGYATTEESASVMRPATPDEKWLHAQMDRIDPHRHEMGSAGDTPALVKLAFELRDALSEVVRISDIKHAALDQAKALLGTQ
jgi:hypothetical protein